VLSGPPGGGGGHGSASTRSTLQFRMKKLGIEASVDGEQDEARDYQTFMPPSTTISTAVT